MAHIRVTQWACETCARAWYASRHGDPPESCPFCGSGDVRATGRVFRGEEED